MTKYNIRETVFEQVRFSDTPGVTSLREANSIETTEVVEVQVNDTPNTNSISVTKPADLYNDTPV